MALWYIDALDPRAGMAIATFREPDLDSDAIDLGKPAVYISPPYFQGESVASRAVGFAATRASFQLGLFLGQSEVSFPTLQGICEFLRRVYTASGGGDSSNGVTPTPVVPNPENEGGEPLLPEEREHSTSVVGVLNFIASLRSEVERMSQDRYSPSAPQQWSRKEETGRMLSLVKHIGSLSDINDLMAYGSAVLIEELLVRFPNSDVARTKWIKSAMKLGHILNRLGIIWNLHRYKDFERLTGHRDAVMAAVCQAHA